MWIGDRFGSVALSIWKSSQTDYIHKIQIAPEPNRTIENQQNIKETEHSF